MSSLYERIGGDSAINAAVDLFYVKVLADARIKHFFSETNMTKQILSQKAFLTMAFGGPNLYKGRDMKAAHAHLLKKGLNDSHVDVVIELLGKTLEELKVPSNLIKEAAAIAESVRGPVLGKA